MLKLDALRDAATVQSGGDSARARVRLQQEMAEMQNWLAEKRHQPFPNGILRGGNGFLREPDKTTAALLANIPTRGSFAPADRDTFLAAAYNADAVTQARTQRQDAMAVFIDQLNQRVDVNDSQTTVANQVQYIGTLTQAQQDQLFEARRIDQALCPPMRIH